MAMQLSTEFIPAHEGTVHAVAVWNDDIIITGGDDNNATIWKRAGAGKDFGAVHTITEHTHTVRAILVIPVGHAGFSTGGFATGCMDKQIRLFSFDPATNACELVRTLSGHTNGVLDLAFTNSGDLISGSWDGTARVWDLATGRCKHTLGNHENGTCVTGLPNGDIIVGSTGRKVGDAHVDYKIRLWSLDTSGGPEAYVVRRTITDHEQAIRDVTTLGEDGAYISVGNDGMVAVRRPDHSIRLSFFNQTSGEGKPFSVFRVAVLSDARIATANEDQHLRIYSLDGAVEEIGLPGTPWAVAGLPNGDVVVGCSQAGTSKRGHVYVFSMDPAKAADEMTKTSYAADMEPPKKSQQVASGSGGAGSTGGFKSSGPYETRAAVQGKSDGQYGFFDLPDGRIMLCTWSAEEGVWVDVGEVQSEDMGGEGETSSFDYSCAVTMDTNNGMKSMTLQFNEADDPMVVATVFCEQNNIPLDNVEQVKDFVIQQKMQRGAATKVTHVIHQFNHFPSSAFADAHVIDFKKVQGKLVENNALVGGAAALNDAEMNAVNEVIAVLEQVARYHSSSVPRAGAALILGKLRAWPMQYLLPVIDVLRILILHGDGAEYLAACGDSFLGPEIHRVHSHRDAPDARGVILTTARLLYNGFRHQSTRNMLMSQLPAMIDVALDLVQFPHVSVKNAGSILLLNIATEIILRRKAELSAADDVVAATVGSVGGTVSANTVPTEACCSVIAAINTALEACEDANSAYNLAAALGTLASVNADTAAFAKELSGESLARLPARFDTDGVKEVSAELRAFLSRYK